MIITPPDVGCMSEEPPRFNVSTSRRMTIITSRMTTTQHAHYFSCPNFIISYFKYKHDSPMDTHTHTHATILAESTLRRTAAVLHWWGTFLALPVDRRFRNRACNQLPYCVGCSGIVSAHLRHCCPPNTVYNQRMLSLDLHFYVLLSAVANRGKFTELRTSHMPCTTSIRDIYIIFYI